MKKLFFVPLLLIGVLPLKAQSDKENQLQALEQNQPADQNVTATATLKSASRLFATRDDLTSVIIVIPADSVVDVLDSDSTYFHVVFNNTEGYIYKRDAVLDKLTPGSQPAIQPCVNPDCARRAGQIANRGVGVALFGYEHTAHQVVALVVFGIIYDVNAIP